MEQNEAATNQQVEQGSTTTLQPSSQALDLSELVTPLCAASLTKGGELVFQVHSAPLADHIWRHRTALLQALGATTLTLRFTETAQQPGDEPLVLTWRHEEVAPSLQPWHLPFQA